MVVAAVAGCKKAGPASDLPRAPDSTADQDALWAVAPAEVRVGVVVSARATGELERAAGQLVAAIAAAPELADVHRAIDAALSQVAPGNGPPQLARIGLANNQGAAFFQIDRHAFAAVVPLANRDLLLQKTHGTKGATEDKIGHATCRTLGARYVCVNKPELFAALGHGGVPALLRDAGARGDLELVAHHLGDGEPEIATVAQLDHGAFVIRGSVGGVPAEVSKLIGSAIAAPANAPTMAGFGVFDLTPALASVPPLPLTAGVSAADVARAIAGPMTFTVAAGTTTLDMQLPLKDPAPVKAVVEQCTSLPVLQELKATASGGACHIPIAQSPLVLDLKVDGKVLHIGTAGTGAPTALPASGIGKLISDGQWAFSFYGRGSLFAANLANQPLAKQALDFPQAAVVLRAISAFNEVGMGLSKDGTRLRFVLGVRTLWSNPDEVVKKLLAIAPQQVIDGAAPAAAQAVASAHPGSPFAQDMRAGVGGGLALTAPMGVIAAVAVPALLDYIRRSKEIEKPALEQAAPN